MADKVSELFRKRSKIAKQARKGHDFGKSNSKGGGFDRLVGKLERKGKSASSAKKIAGAQFWKQMGAK